MNSLQEFIQADTERQLIQKELSPLQDRMNEVMTRIRKINENLSIAEKEFIKLKLWEGFTPDQRERVEAKRDELDRMFSSNSSYALSGDSMQLFDPFYDNWHIIGFEAKESKIRFEVSCDKQEGSISGLMTFLAPYWTAWFDISELSNINNNWIKL